MHVFYHIKQNETKKKKKKTYLVKTGPTGLIGNRPTGGGRTEWS